MERVRRLWLEAPLNFMLTLSARIEATQAMFDAIVLALVIAGLEMQQRLVACAAPVAAEQLRVVLKK